MTDATRHLWEVEHSYYCNEGNHFKNGCGDKYNSLAEFIADHGDSDRDMNLVFRWDWREGEDWGAGAFNGDVYYRNGRLLIFWMGQRKGIYRWSEVSVCRSDEAAVIEFLRPRWEHLRALWEPLA